MDQPSPTPSGLDQDTAANKPALIVLCPYCGNTQTRTDRCEGCGGYFEPLSRQATQIAMGPWFVRDRQQPFRPGCSYETIKKMITAGRITPTTIIRGPSTHQFWSLARNIRGIAHLLGYCHNCHAHVKASDIACATCGATLGDLPHQRNKLDLQYPTEQAVEAAKARLDEALRRQNSGPTTGSGSGMLRGDLLDMALQQQPVSPQAASHQALDQTPTPATTSLPDASEPQGSWTPPAATAPSQSVASAQPPRPVAMQDATALRPASLAAPTSLAPPPPPAAISPLLLILIVLNLVFIVGVVLLYLLLLA